MPQVVLLSVPGLRESDLCEMPNLTGLLAGGDCAELLPSFPAVTCPVQANMTSGEHPDAHGVVANGFFHRGRHEVEMWTAPNDCVGRPQIWDRLHESDPSLTSAVWFPLHSKGCGADHVCTPAPIHNSDGSESMWCYTRPDELYRELIEKFGHFPLHHFWGPLAGIAGSAWIIASAIVAAEQFQPDFFYIYLPHLDYAAQKHGPDSFEAIKALGELDGEIENLIAGFQEAYKSDSLRWIVASEYSINQVNHVSFPNRLLRETGLLKVREEYDGEHLDLQSSAAWALVDHQFSHVFVRDQQQEVIDKVVDLFTQCEGIAQVLTGNALAEVHLNHSRSGDAILVSKPNSWQAY
ncbi:MAG: alkaline phosphatase family protein [Gammaproteobacteria bacterium]|nr:alkaline phosphatase family protein [Gammaproteobacteria bacterium]